MFSAVVEQLGWRSVRRRGRRRWRGVRADDAALRKPGRLRLGQRGPRCGRDHPSQSGLKSSEIVLFGGHFGLVIRIKNQDEILYVIAKIMDRRP